MQQAQSELAAAEASIRDQQAQQHAQLLAAKSEEHAALMRDLAAAHEAATLDKAEVVALRQELQLLRTSDASSQQQSQSEEEEESDLEMAHTLLGLSEWMAPQMQGPGLSITQDLSMSTAGVNLCFLSHFMSSHH
ncbi:TPA: hypothetical protein ACH3X1_005447 [Trebouxia sp. C0004]